MKVAAEDFAAAVMVTVAVTMIVAVMVIVVVVVVVLVAHIDPPTPFTIISKSENDYPHPQA